MSLPIGDRIGPEMDPEDKFDKKVREEIRQSAANLRWKDQTGRVWKVSDMTTSHIKNSMRYLLKRAQEMHDEKTVVSFDAVVNDPTFSTEGEADRARFEYLFDHLRVKPTEWVRRLPIMYAFLYELRDRRAREEWVKDQGLANFEFPR